MVRGRDLKTPLATSAMDKKSNGKKGGPGDPPKKKSKFPVTKGKVNIYSTEGKKIHTTTTKGYESMKGDKGLLKKVPGGYMYTKKVGGSSGKSTKNPSGMKHQSEIKRKKAAKKY